MTTSGALELFRNAVLATAQVVGPALLAALLVGVLVGVVQTATQVNEPSVSFLIKLIAVAAVLAVVGPYSLSRLIEYTRSSIGSISEIVR